MHSLKGKYICFTGKIDDFTRTDLQDMSKEYGFAFMENVTKTTNILVSGKRPGDSKMMKASRLGTRIVSAEDFIVMLNADDDMSIPHPKNKPTKEETQARVNYYDQLEDAGLF